MKITKPQLDELTALTEPIRNWIKENGHPLIQVVIEDYCVTVTEVVASTGQIQET